MSHLKGAGPMFLLQVAPSKNLWAKGGHQMLSLRYPIKFYCAGSARVTICLTR